VVYATSAGAVAQDGTGRNGLFTQELLQHLASPQVEIKEVFNQTGAAVRNVTSGQQVPAVYNQFFDSAWLGKDAASFTASRPATAGSSVAAIAAARPQAVVVPGTLILPAFGQALTLVVDGQRLAGVPGAGDTLVFNRIPAGRSVALALESELVATPLPVPAVTLNSNEQKELDPALYRDWLAIAMADRRAVLASQLASGKRNARFGFVSLAVGAVGAVSSGLFYYLGTEAAKAYATATTTNATLEARRQIEGYSSGFMAFGGIGGAGLALSPFLLRGSADTKSLEQSVAALDESLRRLKVQY
jgi:hypothetical protein